MTRTFFRALVALAVVTVFSLAPAAAQTGQTFGELVGKVTDDQGAVLPGVTVTLSGPAVMGTPTAVTGASNYNLNYYGVTADTPQNYGSMYYMDFGSAEEVSVDTAAMGAEVGGGGGANINVIPKSGGNNVKAEAVYSVTGKGLWDHFTGNNITDDLRAQETIDALSSK